MPGQHSTPLLVVTEFNFTCFNLRAAFLQAAHLRIETYKWQQGISQGLRRENEEWKCGRECVAMAHGSVSYLARDIPWERRRPNRILPAEDIRLSLVDRGFIIQEVTEHSALLILIFTNTWVFQKEC